MQKGLKFVGPAERSRDGGPARTEWASGDDIVPGAPGTCSTAPSLPAWGRRGVEMPAEMGWAWLSRQRARKADL